MEAEVKYMFENEIAVPSSSSWASPSLIVAGHHSFIHTYYRKVNNVPKADSYPHNSIEDCIEVCQQVRLTEGVQAGSFVSKRNFSVICLSTLS